MKYVTVRDYLVELIDTRLSVGDVVPSERELAERFGISRMTVRQAVDSLVSSGMLERRRGSGTYVRAPKVHVQSRISSFSEEMRCLLYTSPNPRAVEESRMPSSA